jgi:hypothetical protein
MHDLPRPEILRCFFDDHFQPPLPVMALCWDTGTPVVAEHIWHLPDGVSINSPAPVRFGVTIYRHGPDAYQVRVLWNSLCLCWECLTRVQIMASALASVLRVLDTDLWYLLTQPVSAVAASPSAKVA